MDDKIDMDDITDRVKGNTIKGEVSVTIGPSMGPRADVLCTAARAVLQDRQNLHGAPEDSFKDIADLWEGWNGIKYTRTDVAVMLALLKIARVRKTPTYKDNWADIAGYAACGFEAALADEKEKSKND